MLIPTSENKQAIFKVNGSLAAIINEDCWEKLLRGEVVGIIEPDPNRWSLYVNGEHVKTYTAADLRGTIEKVFKEHTYLDKWLMDGANRAETHPACEHFAEIVNGYPYIMCLDPTALEHYQREGVSAKTMATRMRGRLHEEYANLHLAKQEKNIKAIDILGSQIHIHGMTREGRS